MAESTNLTDNGSTSEFLSSGDFSVHVSGSFGSGTLALQTKLINGTFQDIPDSVVTAESDYIAEVLEASIYRLTLTGATTPNLVIDVRGKSIS